MSNIVDFYPADAAKDPDNVLKQAVGEYESVVVLGWDKNEDFDARASINLSKAEINYLVDVLKRMLLEDQGQEMEVV